ncbi:tyrosine-protein phosphatase [Paraburkholderia sp. J76]|uniref:tyrosine-protein phosphatase n=1 Tax=Paraburkholderia sp. J76 TaxID=2805439 RepID=UPI002ABE2599|nr:tyrosine-protein phosphatase [Paraburkholderia sp. J76]
MAATGNLSLCDGAALANPPRRALLKGTMSLLALSGCASTLLSACGGDYTGSDGTQDASSPVIGSVANFRDLGGAAPGYSTSDGAHVRRAFIFRSDVLKPDAADSAKLERMALSNVYDLRTPAEIDAAPDMPGAASFLALNVLGTPEPPSFAGMLASELDAAMQTHWRTLVTGRTQCAIYGALLQHIADAPGPLLITGGTGVDVAGWACALLLLIANVPLEIIVKDFMLTDAWRPASVDSVTAASPVQASYLQAAFDAVQESYGDLNRYLGVGLGLASETVSRLRGRLVV